MRIVECTDAVRNAAARYRAILRNNEVGSTPAQQREWDDRVATAEVVLERTLLDSGAMSPDEAIESIAVISGGVSVLTDLPRCIFIPISCREP